MARKARTPGILKKPPADGEGIGCRAAVEINAKLKKKFGLF